MTVSKITKAQMDFVLAVVKESPGGISITCLTEVLKQRGMKMTPTNLRGCMYMLTNRKLVQETMRLAYEPARYTVVKAAACNKHTNGISWCVDQLQSVLDFARKPNLVSEDAAAPLWDAWHADFKWTDKDATR